MLEPTVKRKKISDQAINVRTGKGIEVQRAPFPKKCTMMQRWDPSQYGGISSIAE